MKKLLLVALVFVMILSSVACSTQSSDTADTKEPEKTEEVAKETEETKEEAPEVQTVDMSETMTLKGFMWGPRDIDPEDEIVKHFNELLNVDIQIERLLKKEYTQTLETKIAANDLPDFFRNTDNDYHIYSNLLEDDYLANYSEYIEKYNFTNLAAYFETDNIERFSENGEFYRSPSKKGGNDVGLIVRKDWVDEVGMEMPKDHIEFAAMLQAFKDNNLGGENTVPFTTFDIGFLRYMVTGFVPGNGWIEQDGTYIASYTHEGHKDALKYLNDLYEKGLLDKEVFTLNETQANGKLLTGKAGSIVTTANNRLAKLTPEFAEAQPDGELTIAVPLPTGPLDNRVDGLSGFNGYVLVIKDGRDEQKIARTMALMDAMHSEEGMDIIVKGIEGVHYTMNGSEKTLTEAGERDIVSGIGNIMAMLTDYSEGLAGMTGVAKENYDSIQAHATVNPAEGYNGPAIQEYQSYLDEVKDAWFVDFVTGKKDVDADWDAYIDALNKVGLEEITADVNQYLAELQ